MSRAQALLFAALASLPLAPRPALATAQTATFALVLGVNRSVERELPLLRYADDDAARYFELFRLIGAKTYLLTRFDQASRRVHVQAAAEAGLPLQATLRQTVRRLAGDVAQARRRGVKTLLYLTYAGHGKVGQRRSYLTLEDARLDGEALARQVVGAVGADASHLIVDACNSYLLAIGRGPGGVRRELRDGFSRLAGTLLAPEVGLLLSTSAGQESHEWEGVQAGVFSHAVRSGLHGAADADGDGQISYREIAAFVDQAQRAIPNERFRARVFAQPPAASAVLLDLRARLGSGLELDGAQHGRYLLEDLRGVRLVDFHSGVGQRVRLVRPAGRQLYLRRLPDQLEYAIPAGDQLVQVAALVPERPRTAARGAAQHAFARLFELPYDRTVVQRYQPLPPPTLTELELRQPGSPTRGLSPRRVAAWTTLALTAGALAAGGACSLSALGLQADAPAQESHLDRVSRNSAISRRNTAAATLYAVGGAAAVSSLLLFLWPEAASAPPALGTLGVGPQELGLSVSSAF